jgi:hypothetical protein
MQKGIIRVVGINLLVILVLALCSGLSPNHFSLNAFGMIGGLVALILTPINGTLSAVNFIKKSDPEGSHPSTNNRYTNHQ